MCSNVFKCVQMWALESLLPSHDKHRQKNEANKRKMFKYGFQMWLLEEFVSAETQPAVREDDRISRHPSVTLNCETDCFCHRTQRPWTCPLSFLCTSKNIPIKTQLRILQDLMSSWKKNPYNHTDDIKIKKKGGSLHLADSEVQGEMAVFEFF